MNSLNQTVKLERIELLLSPTVVITKKLKKQIDFLHNRVGKAEWSGELLTREEGDINDIDNWRVICEDIYLADIGTSGYTEYEVDKGGFKIVDVVEMYDKFPELFEGKLKNHHIHTHHGMGAFFSPTDWEQLETRACTANYFIMLIVDFKNTYKAKLAFKAKLSSGKNSKLKFANNLDGYKDITLSADAEKDVLVVIDCNIEWESPELEEVDDFTRRFEAVKAAIEEEDRKKKQQEEKEKEKKAIPNPLFPPYQKSFDWSGRDSYETAKEHSNKRISEMTQKEWEKLENTTYIFTKMDGYAILNGALQESFILNYESPLAAMFLKDKTFKNNKEAKIYSKEFVDNMKTIFDAVFLEADDEDYADLLEIIVNELTPFKYNRFIDFLIKELIDVQIEIDNPDKIKSLW